jgi:Cu/Ag efflux protein CusF
MSRWRHVLWLWAVVCAGAALAQAGPMAPADTVYTRARVVSVLQEPGSAGKLYVRLKLVPQWKLPFATQAFRVTDRALLDGIPEGAWVKFTARRVEGENTLTSIHVVEACKRFQPCD